MAKKLIKIDKEELEELDKELAPIISSKELEEGLEKVNQEVTDIIISGTTDNLTQLSWDLYEKFKKGQLKSYFEDDKELESYYKIRRQEAILKMITFMDLATSEILNKKKLDIATIKELTSAMQTVSNMINTMMGQASTIVDHRHKHSIANEDEIKERMQHTKKRIESIDAEFEEILNSEASEDDNIDL